jgi:hypothetical protein
MKRHRVEFIAKITCTYEVAASNPATAKDKAIMFYQLREPSPDILSNMERTAFEHIATSLVK